MFCSPTPNRTESSSGSRDNSENYLYHFRHRNLNPKLGVWQEQDPAEYVDGANLYRLLHSSPTNHRDPNGLVPLWFTTPFPTIPQGPTPPYGDGGSKFDKALEAILTVGPSEAWAASHRIADDAFAGSKRIAADLAKRCPNLNPAWVEEAARHMLWQAYMSQEFGQDDAKKIGDIHEQGEVEAGRGADSARDQANNQAGRNLLQGDMILPADAIEDIVRDAILGGNATGLDGKPMKCQCPDKK